MRIRPAKPIASSVWKWLITCGRACHFCISPISLVRTNTLEQAGDKQCLGHSEISISLAYLRGWLVLSSTSQACQGLNTVRVNCFLLPPLYMYVLRYRDSSHSIPVSSQKVVSGRITTRLKESTAKYKVVQNCHPEKVTNKAKFK